MPYSICWLASVSRQRGVAGGCNLPSMNLIASIEARHCRIRRRRKAGSKEACRFAYTSLSAYRRMPSTAWTHSTGACTGNRGGDSPAPRGQEHSWPASGNRRREPILRRPSISETSGDAQTLAKSVLSSPAHRHGLTDLLLAPEWCSKMADADAIGAMNTPNC